MRKKLSRTLGIMSFAMLLLGVAVVIKMGPRFVIGILRYDTRQEGALRVGERAPDVGLLALDGKSTVQLSQRLGQRPLVLVFGSFT